MLVLENWGIPLVHIKMTPGNTARQLQPEHVFYTEWTVSFTSGGTTQLYASYWVKGATSNQIGKIIYISDPSSGTWAGGDAAGTMRLNSCQSAYGTSASWTSGENILYAGGTDDATLTLLPKVAPMSGSYLIAKGMPARAALVVCYANTALVGFDRGRPDQTQLVGMPMVANSSLLLRDIEQIKNFWAIDYTSGSASILQITLFF